METKRPECKETKRPECKPEYRKAQVVVMKSPQGFADRLMVLNQCLLYCLKYHAVICVDWEDSTWGIPFHELFELLGVYSVPKAKVLAMIEQGSTLTKHWTYEDVKNPICEKTKNMKYVGDWMATDDAVRFHTEQPTEEILVTNGLGRRTTNFELLCITLRLKKDIADIVRSRLPTCEYLMVHLRGTDRKVDGFMENMIEGFRDVYTQWKDGLILTVADDNEMLQQWITEFPACGLYNPLMSTPRLYAGITHLSTPEELHIHGLTKREMNIELLCDFFGIMFATARFGMIDSSFFSLAGSLNQFGGREIID